MKHRLTYLPVLSMLFLSCSRDWQHQYPEDDMKTKSTPQQRIIKKKWRLSKVILNNVDYSDSVKKSFSNLMYYFWDEGDGNMYPYKSGLVSFMNNSMECNDFMWWKFGLDENTIEFRQRYSDTSFIPGWLNGNYLDSKSWTILKLTAHEFKISIETVSKDTMITNTFVLP